MISLNHFTFMGKSSIDFDVLVDVFFESDNGLVESFLNREAVATTIYDGSRRNIHGFKYNEMLCPTFTITKKDFSDFSETENRKILAWLTSSTNVERMTCYRDDSEVISFVLIGNITQIEQRKLANSRVISYSFVFDNISPYAYSSVKSINKTITAPETFILKCNTDVYEKNLYPRITVTIGDSIYLSVTEDPTVETFEMLSNTVYEYNGQYYIKINGQKHALSVTPNTIENQTADASIVNTYCLSTSDKTVYLGVVVDNQYGWQKIVTVGAGFEIKNTYYENGVDTTIKSAVIGCHENEVITLNGDNRLISSSDTPMRVIGNSFNWDWIYFVPGENEITISGACDVVIEWVEPIKIGNI